MRSIYFYIHVRVWFAVRTAKLWTNQLRLSSSLSKKWTRPSTLRSLICGICASWIIFNGYTALSNTGLRLPAPRELSKLHHCFPSPSALAHKYLYIQGDSEGKFYFEVGGDGVGHCEKKYLYEYVCNCGWILRYMFEYTNIKALWKVIRKEKWLSFNMFLLISI